MKCSYANYDFIVWARAGYHLNGLWLFHQHLFVHCSCGFFFVLSLFFSVLLYCKPLLFSFRFDFTSFLLFICSNCHKFIKCSFFLFLVFFFFKCWTQWCVQRFGAIVRIFSVYRVWNVNVWTLGHFSLDRSTGPIVFFVVVHFAFIFFVYKDSSEANHIYIYIYTYSHIVHVKHI